MSTTRILDFEEDVQLECDLAHNRYLQSLIAKQIMSEIAETVKANINNQLQLNRNVITKLQTKEEQNKQQEKSLEDKIEISTNLKDLENVLNDYETIIQENTFTEKLNDSKKELVAASNKLYFQNVKMFENQIETNNFAETLNKTCEQIQIVDIANNRKEIKELAENICEYLVTSADVMQKEKNICEISDHIGPLFLAKMADIGAALNGDDDY